MKSSAIMKGLYTFASSAGLGLAAGISLSPKPMGSCNFLGGISGHLIQIGKTVGHGYAWMLV